MGYRVRIDIGDLPFNHCLVAKPDDDLSVGKLQMFEGSKVQSFRWWIRSLDPTLDSRTMELSVV